MPIYEYRALHKGGRKATGFVDADTERDARMELRSGGMYVTDLAEVRPKPATGGLFAKIRASLGQKPDKNLALITRQFATLVGAGLPLVDVLSVLIEQVGNKSLETVLRDVREKVKQGSSLADALSIHPSYFSEVYVNMARAGEASGNLASIFDSLASYAERRSALRGRLSAALIYPVILALTGLGVVVFLVTYVVPRFERLMSAAGKALPLPTLILTATSDFVKERFWLILVAIIAAVVVWRALQRSHRVRYALDDLTLRLPVVGELIRKQLVCYFSTTFATLLASGMRVSEALVIVKSVVQNRVFASAIEDLQRKIGGGRDIASTLREGGVFPPLVRYMIAVGEKSGRLEEMLRRISVSYEREIGISLQKVVAVLEPAIVIAMAGMVAFVVVAILLPILALSQLTF